jgi:hypothetical protein
MDLWSEPGFPHLGWCSDTVIDLREDEDRLRITKTVRPVDMSTSASSMSSVIPIFLAPFASVASVLKSLLAIINLHGPRNACSAI